MNIKRIGMAVAGIVISATAFAKPTITVASAKVSGGNSSGRLDISYAISDKSSKNPDLDCRYVQLAVYESKSLAEWHGKKIHDNYEPEMAGGSDYIWAGNRYETDEVCDGTHSFSVDLEYMCDLTAREFKQEYPNAYLLAVVYDDCDNTCSYKIVPVSVDSVSTVSDYAKKLYSKVQTLTGLCVSDYDEEYFGTVSVKVGKINAKTGVVNVSATITPFTGSKKLTASAKMVVDEEEEEGFLYGTLPFKSPVGDVQIAIFGELYEDERGKTVAQLYFDGWNEETGYGLNTADVGGAFEASVLRCTADMDWDMFDFGECWYVVAALGEEPIYVSRGTKWSFDKSPTLKYVRHREYGDVWYELEGLEDCTKPNVSGLKLTYTAKTGVFKGSYYIYLSNSECVDDGQKPTLKKLKVSVSGVVVDGKGYGKATVKFAAETYTWPISITADDECGWKCRDEPVYEDDPGCIYCVE